MTKRNLIGMLIVLGTIRIATATSYKIPFRLVKNLIVVQATVEKRSGNFIIDTGLSELILNSTYLPTYRHSNGGGQVQSMHGEMQYDHGNHVRLQLGELSVRTYAAVVDLQPIEKKKRLNILGMIGIRVFSRYEIMIDNFAQQIILYELDEHGNRLQDQPLPIPTVTFDLHYKRHLSCIKIWIGDLELHMGLDTGVETNVFSLKTYENIKDYTVDPDQKTMIDLSGNTIQVLSAKVKNMRIDHLLLPPMESIFVPPALSKKSLGANLDGLLGQAFLRNFQVAFNFKKKEFCLWNEETTNQGPLVKNKN